MTPKTYFSVKDIFYTIQGEGANAGRAAVFVRFAGCNGWSGREMDRSKGPFPCSRWCDTDFLSGRRMHEDDLVSSIMELFPKDTGWPMIVFTGGEPALQLTDSLLDRLLNQVPMICIETNGTLTLPSKAFVNCWITVSPKTEKVKQDRVSELKLIHPTIDPSKFGYIKSPWRFLQPLHNNDWQKNTAATVAYVKAHPEWRLSLQTHKFIGVE